MTEQYPRFDSMSLIIALALILYIIPWVLNPSMTLSLGAYDFAEFLTKQEPFDYNTTLALRGQLFILTCLLAVRVHRPYFTAHWWWHLIICIVLVIAQLPPLTFFSNFNDINQQQQALLSGASLIAVLIGLSGFLWKYRHLVSLILMSIGVASVIYGLINAIDIMNDYAIPAQFGFGGIGLSVLYVVISLWSLVKIFSK